MKTYILIEAEEGTTEDILMCRGTYEDFCNLVRDTRDRDVRLDPDRHATYEDGTALLNAVLEPKHDENRYRADIPIIPIDPKVNGRYSLVTDGLWHEWTLIIADDRYVDPHYTEDEAFMALLAEQEARRKTT